MSDHVTLIGAEDVRSAGLRMAEAARTIEAAASTIDFALAQHRQFLDDWLTRFADVMAVQGTAPAKESER